MKVYIVVAGRDFEGYRIKSVHFSEDTALEAAAALLADASNMYDFAETRIFEVLP